MESKTYAGHIYQRENPGDPWTLAGPAASDQVVITKRADPVDAYKVPKAQIDIAAAEANNARTALLNNRDRTTLPFDARKAQADALRAEAEATVAQRTAASTPAISADQQAALAHKATLDSIVEQINRVSQLYREGPGATQGIEGVLDYLPTPTNRQFDSAAAGLGEQGMAAFRVPGQGTQSDSDAARFVAANQPTAASYDIANEERLRQLRARVDANRKAAGMPQAQWDMSTAASDIPADRSKASGVVGAVTNTPTDGGTFADAAGVAMAGKLADAYKGGATLEQLNSLLADNGFQPFSDPASIEKIKARERIGFAPPAAMDNRSSASKAIGAMGANAAGAYGLNSVDAVTGGYLDELTGGQTQLAKDYAQDQFPMASLVGTVTGAAAATLPVVRATEIASAASPIARLLLGSGARAAATGDALYGAALGSGENNDNRLKGALTGAVTGAGGNLGGSLVARALGSAVRGVTDPAVRYMTERGIPLTMGQTLGNRGFIGRTMNKLESIPGLGDLMGARRGDGVRAWNLGTINDALAPIGQTVQGEAGQAAVGQAQDLVSDAYTRALSGVNVTADQPFVQTLADAMARGRAVPVQGDQFGHFMDQRVGPLFGPGGTLDGAGAQAALQAVRGARSNFGSEGAMGSLVSDELGTIDQAIVQLLARQAPQAAEGLNAANAAYARLQPINSASASAVNSGMEAGVYSPSQLNRAVTTNTKNYGGRAAAARGENQTDLMRYGQEVLPSTVPNSGTFDRGMAALLLPGALGGASYGLSDLSPTTAAIVALLAAGSTRAGGKAVQNALVRRPDAARRVGTAIAKSARMGGMVAAPLALAAGN